MIISPDFIWLHFPKCAGTLTEKLLRKLAPQSGSIVFDPIDPLNVIWHQTIKQREKKTGNSLEGREVICNFRRLPYWIISRIRYEQQRAGKNVPLAIYRKGCFYEQDGRPSDAEEYVERYTEREVNHWIRVEYLQNDFTKVFSKYFILDQEVISDFMKVKINTSDWDGNMAKWFGPDDLEMLYQSCPKWTALEMELYGDLVIDRF